MNKATPVQMRVQLEIVDSFKKAGLRFVPMPAFDDDDYDKLVSQMAKRLDKIEKEAEVIE